MGEAIWPQFLSKIFRKQSVKYESNLTKHCCASGDHIRQCPSTTMAVHQVPSIITGQLAQCEVDAALCLSQASQLKNQTQGKYLSQSKALSCLSSTMVKSNEPDDTATSALEASTASRPLQAHELELSISGVYAQQLTAAAGSGVDVQGANSQASLGRITDVIEESYTSSAESGEVSLVRPPMKRIRSNALTFNTEGNEIDLEKENMQLKCPPSIMVDGVAIGGGNKSASSSDKDLSWPPTSRPLDWKQAMSWQSSPNHFTHQPFLLKQLTQEAVSKVRPSDSQGVHIRDETIPLSTGVPYGKISEMVTLYGNEVFEQNNSPTEFCHRNFTQWHPSSTDLRQHITRTDSPAGAYQENVSLDLHNTIIGRCSVEGKQGLGYLPQRGTELVSNPSFGFGIPLAPVFSAIQPNATIPECPFTMQASSELLLQSLRSASYSGMNVPFLASMKPSNNLMPHSGHQASHFETFQSILQRPPSDSAIQMKVGQPSPFNSVLSSAKHCSSLIPNPNLSLLAYSKAPPSSSSAPLYSFPSTLENFASASNLPAATGGMGSKLLGSSHASPDIAVPNFNSVNSEVHPSITVVMEGRSIGGRICLHKLDGYDSFALTIWDMFKNSIPEDNLVLHRGGYNPSNAVPGYVIAYEDAEGDLLLAGDLSWRQISHKAVTPGKQPVTVPMTISDY
eukprot:Gb_03276 [translate_table: standard]